MWSVRLVRYLFLWGIGLAVVAGVAACAPVESSRDSWLQSQLTEDNWLLIQREPALAAGKYRKMAEGIYPYFRGTVRVYLADSTRPHALASPTQLGALRAGWIASVVDPHPENIGSYRDTKGQQVADFNDFDGATYLPFFVDLRRLTVGFAMAAQAAGMHQRDPKVYEALFRRVTEGYLEQLRDLKDGKPALRLQPGQGMGMILDDLFRRAKEQGDAKEEMDEFTRIKDGVRTLVYGEVEPAVSGILSKYVSPVSDAEEALLRQAFAGYFQTRMDAKSLDPSHFAIKGMSKRFGAGVSSYPRMRFYVLVEGPTRDAKDDMILEWKELADPPHIQGWTQWPKQLFRNNGERVVSLQRQMQTSSHNDIHLGWSEVAPMVFRVRQLTEYQKNFSVERWMEKYAESKWKAQDLVVFAFWAGKLLARAHALAPTPYEISGLDGLWSVVSSREEALLAETSAFAKQYAAQLTQDFSLFRDLLQRTGPLLGYRSSHESTDFCWGCPATGSFQP